MSEPHLLYTAICWVATCRKTFSFTGPDTVPTVMVDLEGNPVPEGGPVPEGSQAQPLCPECVERIAAIRRRLTGRSDWPRKFAGS